MRIASGIEMLEISSIIMGTASIINPTLLWDNETVILVDTGNLGQFLQIREAIEQAGVAFDRLEMVIVTHHDMDHIGSLSSIQKELPDRVKVLAHEKEKAYIQGEKKPIKMTVFEANRNSMPKEMKAIYEKLKAGYQDCKSRVDRVLADGEELPYCGGITVIYTPGHTPGHICLYLQKFKTLIAGDALFVEGGKLVKPPSFLTFDMGASKESLKKLTKYNIETVICYHGGLYKDNANQRIATLANE